MTFGYFRMKCSQEFFEKHLVCIYWPWFDIFANRIHGNSNGDIKLLVFFITLWIVWVASRKRDLGTSENVSGLFKVLPGKVFGMLKWCDLWALDSSYHMREGRGFAWTKDSPVFQRSISQWILCIDTEHKISNDFWALCSMWGYGSCKAILCY